MIVISWKDVKNDLKLVGCREQPIDLDKGPLGTGGKWSALDDMVVEEFLIRGEGKGPPPNQEFTICLPRQSEINDMFVAVDEVQSPCNLVKNSRECVEYELTSPLTDWR